MNAPSKKEELLPQTVAFQLDGKTIHAYQTEALQRRSRPHGKHPKPTPLEAPPFRPDTPLKGP